MFDKARQSVKDRMLSPVRGAYELALFGILLAALAFIMALNAMAGK